MPCSSQHLDSVQLALEQIDLIRRLVNKHPQNMVLVTTAEGTYETASGRHTNVYISENRRYYTPTVRPPRFKITQLCTASLDRPLAPVQVHSPRRLCAIRIVLCAPNEYPHTRQCGLNLRDLCRIYHELSPSILPACLTANDCDYCGPGGGSSAASGTRLAASFASCSRVVKPREGLP